MSSCIHFSYSEKEELEEKALLKEKELSLEIKKLNNKILKWKAAWFNLRDIIGWHGYNSLPDSYKK